ncbi:MAG: hypothetical protein KJO07_14425 [Deltaproteobacteria bacterium]|jgi:hypothetical protein|nr:hypothetical protein [Deltaproteobacteria bacterium]
MKKLRILFVSALLALSAIGCGDNLVEESDIGQLPSDRDSELIIIPHQDQAIAALESIDELGFEDPTLYDDIGVITAFGDLSLATKARTMPGIYDVMPAEEGKPLPDYGIESQAPSQDDTPGDLHGDSGVDFQPRIEREGPESPRLGGASLHQAGAEDGELYSPDEVIGGKR